MMPMPTPCSIGSTTIASIVATIEREFGRAAPPDVDHTPARDDALRDEQQHAGERGMRHMREHIAAEQRKGERERRADERARVARRRPSPTTTAVRGGLASTGKAPMKPARRLAAPTPMKSRLTSGPLAGSETKLRVVAAVCTITTTLTISASGAISRKAGNRQMRASTASARRRRSRRASRRRAPPNAAPPSDAVASASAIKAPGTRGLSSSPRQHDREHAEADAKVHGLAAPRPPPSAARFSTVEPGGAARRPAARAPGRRGYAPRCRPGSRS